MLNSILRRFIYPAPAATYTGNDMEGSLCWLPWNETVSAPSGQYGNAECMPQKQFANPDCPQSLPCLWLPAKKSASVLMYFHANAEDLGVVYCALAHLQKQLQVNVLALEYPGYGLLKDYEPSEESIRNASMVALRHVVSEIGVPYAQVMLLGRSLGCSPAIYLASRYPVGGVILVNSFTSLAKAAEAHVGKSFSSMAFGNAWNNEAIIGNVSCAILFIHAARDRTVPMEHSARLFQKCRSRKLLITPETMEHNSHLFADPQFLAVPAIHFFHFPCYQTNNPPTMPPHVFKQPVVPLQQTDDWRTPWSCNAKSCTSTRNCTARYGGGGSRDDEVSVPVGTVVLGEVDVADKRQSTRPVSQALLAQKGACKGMDSCSETVPGEMESGVNLNPPRCFESTKPPRVAPGDESAGWPAQQAPDKPWEDAEELIEEV